MARSTDASSTYRGYRKQALYVLWRLLTDPEANSRSYRPEGDEDLAVFAGSGDLLQVVQVKDYSAPLALSDFKPESPDGFFARMAVRRRVHPTCEVCIASFGPIGPELDRAIRASGSERNSVANKLSSKNSKLTVAEAETLLHALSGRVSRPVETDIYRDVLASLLPTNAGVHADTAIELLLYSIFDASEHRRTITRSTLLQQLERIGAYLAALRDHSTEWNVTVGPLHDEELDPAERDRLRDSYRRGVQASWRHILAGADCARPGRLAEVHAKLNTHAAVVIRGASGQGKWSIAFRYMREYCAEGLRFEVRFIEGRTHAVRIANALRDHIRALRLPAVVLLDLSPSDSGWMELVQELASAGIKVLVTVREEDFHRAGLLTADMLVAEVALDALTRAEAEEIYRALQSAQPAIHLDCADVWARFAAHDAGPLLEFTHIVTEGETLSSKVAQQVARLQNEVSAGRGIGISDRHLHLLALAAIANAAECRVLLQPLCSVVGVETLARPTAMLEDEYFARVTTTGSSAAIAPIHAVRSQAIVDALLQDCPERWLELAVECLPLIVDADLERFLLVAFSRRPESTIGLLEVLQALRPRTWTHAGGIARAVIWEGLNRYEHENHAVLAQAVIEHGDGWWLYCDPHVASDANASDVARNAIASVLKLNVSELPVVPLTNKAHALEPFRRWAEHASGPASEPASVQDWMQLADVAFWLGRNQISGPIREAASRLPERVPSDWSSLEMAEFISGRYALEDSAFAQWHGHHSAAIIDRFVRDTSSIAVVFNDHSARVLFPVAIRSDGAAADSDAHDFHAQAMKRVTLLRHLFPNLGEIGSEGVGIEVLGSLLPNDPTDKSIPADGLPLARVVQLNATFRQLVTYRLQRPNSWGTYIDTILTFRRVACDTFRGLQRAWLKFLEHPKITASDVRRMPGKELTQLQGTSVPMFPKSAVDEWGFVSESRDNVSDTEAAARSQLWGNIRRFSKWRKQWQEYEQCVGRVAQKIVEVTVLHLAEKNFANSSTAESDSGRLLVVNLAFAWKALHPMQSEFRRWFTRLAPTDAFAMLERHELSVFAHLWPVAFATVYSPSLGRSGVGRIEADLRDQRRQFVRALKQEVLTTLGPAANVQILEGPFRVGERTCIAVVCDHHTVADADGRRADVVRPLWQATRFRQWKHFESTPLEVEWSHILVVHSIKGRALSSTGSLVSTQVLFGSEQQIQVAGHHLLPVPVDLAAVGVPVWESPIVFAAANFQAHVSLFVLAMMRFASLVKSAIKHSLQEHQLEAALAAYSREITVLRSKAVAAHDDLSGLLRAWGSESGNRSSELDVWIHRLEEFSKVALMAGISGTATLTYETFGQWAQRTIASSNEIQLLLKDIVDASIAKAA